ncbi:MAG TPA: DUF433 domain-containing protein [bacterium]
MSLAIAAKPISIEKDSDGVFRVGGTRVTLDTIIAAFTEGATAEEIVFQYPSLNLADVYEVIGYYLRNRSEIEAYLKHRQKEAIKIRQQNENLFDPQGVRDRLMARQSRKKA